MIPTRSQLIDLIPPPSGDEDLVANIQQTDDIIFCVYDAVKRSEGYKYNEKTNLWVKNPNAVPYVADYSRLFITGNTEGNKLNVDGVCNDIWDFMQQEWPYDSDMAEGEERQTGRTVRYMIYDMIPYTFDCKHYSTFAYTTLRALGIPCSLRLTTYKNPKFTLIPDEQPSHIYCVAGLGKCNEEDGRYEEEFIIDGTMPNYDEESKEGVIKYTPVKIKA